MMTPPPVDLVGGGSVLRLAGRNIVTINDRDRKSANTEFTPGVNAPEHHDHVTGSGPRHVEVFRDMHDRGWYTVSVRDREGDYLFKCGDESVLRVYQRPNGVAGILDHAGEQQLWFPQPADQQARSLPGTHRFSYSIDTGRGQSEWWLLTITFDDDGYLVAVNGQEYPAG